MGTISHTLKLTPQEKELVTTLILTYRSLTAIPVEVFTFQHLEVLDLSHNQLESIPIGLSQLPKLKKIIASHNLIKDIAFCPYLESLDVSWNRISVVPEAIYEMPLTYIDLSYNRISTLKPSKKIRLQPATELNLSHNQLTTIHGFIHYYKALKKLTLKNNLLRTIPKGIKNVKSLEILNVEGNRINKISNFLGQNACLRELNLAENNITELPGEIGALKGLHRLYLKGNKLKHFPDFLSKIPSLFVLDLEKNKLKELSVLSSFPMLAELNVSYNQIAELNIDPKAVKNLRNFNCSANRITQVPEEIIRNLHQLSASQNKLQSISSSDANRFPFLTNLELGKNKLHSLNGYFPKVKALDLSGNPFKPSAVQLVNSFPSLENLQLAASFDTEEVLTYLKRARVLKMKEDERVKLFRLPKKDIPFLSPLEQYYVIFMGNPQRKWVLDFITRKAGISLKKNPLEQDKSTLLLIGEIHFMQPFFEDIIKHKGFRVVRELSQHPSHIILGNNIKKQPFLEVMGYASQHKIIFLLESDFYQKVLIDLDTYTALSNSDTMQNNLQRLLSSQEEHNQSLGLQMVLSNGLPPNDKIRETLLWHYQNNQSEEIRDLVYNIFMLNGLDLPPKKL